MDRQIAYLCLMVSWNLESVHHIDCEGHICFAIKIYIILLKISLHSIEAVCLFELFDQQAILKLSHQAFVATYANIVWALCRS